MPFHTDTDAGDRPFHIIFTYAHRHYRINLVTLQTQQEKEKST